MLINILPWPLNVPQDSRVYVYEYGTTTEADVYSDTYYTVASQPLITNSRGMVSALAEQGVYDVKVCDENDNLIYSVERIISTGIFTDAPNDGKEYVRKNQAWQESEKGLFESAGGFNFGGND